MLSVAAGLVAVGLLIVRKPDLDPQLPYLLRLALADPLGFPTSEVAAAHAAVLLAVPVGQWAADVEIDEWRSDPLCVATRWSTWWRKRTWWCGGVCCVGGARAVAVGAG